MSGYCQKHYDATCPTCKLNRQTRLWLSVACIVEAVAFFGLLIWSR